MSLCGHIEPISREMHVRRRSSNHMESDGYLRDTSFDKNENILKESRLYFNWLSLLYFNVEIEPTPTLVELSEGPPGLVSVLRYRLSQI
jgi:hypothetical protein